MPSPKITVHIIPDDLTVDVSPGVTLREILDQLGIHLNYYCGGKGRCGKCAIRFLEGAPAPSLQETKLFGDEEIAGGKRLACITRPEGSCTIEIPSESRSGETGKPAGGEMPHPEPDPEIEKVHLKINPASLDNPQSDFDLIRSAVQRGDLEPAAAFLRRLPHILRKSGGHVAVTLNQYTIIDIEEFESNGEENNLYGIAVDLGTTTMAAVLYRIDIGKPLFHTSVANPQKNFGADVVSRIQYVSGSGERLERLQKKTVDSINQMLETICNTAGISCIDILSVTLAGNTTMQHLFLKIPPDYLAAIPYTPAFHDGLSLRSEEAGLMTHHEAPLYTFPTIGGFVGGDTVADILISNMDGEEEFCLLVDIGTNGEIVLGNRNRLIASSTAAGPAFEGANIKCGGTAIPGAIDHVSLENGLTIRTIDGEPAISICGTGLISLAAELVRKGLLDPSGRINPGKCENGKDTGQLKNRFHKTDGGWKLILASSKEGAAREVFIDQEDIRELQLAKGAMSAGIRLLLDHFGSKVEDIQRIYLAGAFGNFVLPEDAMTIGLIPRVEKKKIVFLGDAALKGAAMTLVRKDHKRRAEKISRNVEFVELAGKKEFQDIFALSMMFSEFI